MPYYELLYIIPPQHTEEEIETITKKVTELIQKKGGEINLTEKLGKFKLAYPIKHNYHGNYVLTEFDASASSIKKLNEDLKLMSEILRHLIVTKKKRSAEEIAEEQALRERIMRKEEKESEVAKKEVAPAKPVKEEKKVSLEELDKKLDEILEGKID